MKNNLVEMNSGMLLATFANSENIKHINQYNKLRNDGEDIDCNLAEVFAEAYGTDYENEMDRVVSMYAEASDVEKAIIDNVLVALCGWCLPTLVEKSLDQYREENHLGLPDEIYAKILEACDGDADQAIDIIEGWGVEACEKGYFISDFDGTGMLEVCRIDECAIFDDDAAAVQKAIEDGVKVIPVAELPDNFDRKYLGWIDTPENREAIKAYADRHVSAN